MDFVRSLNASDCIIIDLLATLSEIPKYFQKTWSFDDLCTYRYRCRTDRKIKKP